MVDFRSIMSAYPQPQSDDYVRKGVAFAKQGHWKEAASAYQEALRLDPDNPQTYLNLGFVYYELGYDREAQEAFDKASKLQAKPCAR